MGNVVFDKLGGLEILMPERISEKTIPDSIMELICNYINNYDSNANSKKEGEIKGGIALPTDGRVIIYFFSQMSIAYSAIETYNRHGFKLTEELLKYAIGHFTYTPENEAPKTSFNP